MNREIPDISVVVLAYQAADSIDQFVSALVNCLENTELHWEIILVGNFLAGSADKTPQTVSNLAKSDPRIRPVIKEKRGMMGWDMKSGLKNARGNTIAVIDGDGQMPAEDVMRVYKLLNAESLDIAKTFRTTRHDGTYRRLISFFYNLIFRILFPGLKSKDINSKPKILTRNALEQLDLQSNGWFIDAEIMIQARRKQLRFGEIETTFYSRDKSPSFIKPMAIFEFLGNLLVYRLKEFLK